MGELNAWMNVDEAGTSVQNTKKIKLTPTTSGENLSESSQIPRRLQGFEMSLRLGTSKGLGRASAFYYL